MFLYENLINETAKFALSGCNTGSIGTSVLRQSIPYICVDGSDCSEHKKTVIITGCIHAREHITVLLTLALAKDALKAKFKTVFYFVPCVNPDGFRLATEGIGFLDERKEWHRYKKYLDKIPNRDYPLWKANVLGVDLNVNFDAAWGEGKLNTFFPSSENYVGQKPFDQPETQALRSFTLAVKPDLTVSYHCKGEVIYWSFKQCGRRLWRDYTLAKKLAAATEYKLRDRDGSAGGYKDWCISELKIPAVTIEVGNDRLKHPLSYETFPDIYDKNRRVLYEIERFLYPKTTEKS